MLSYTVTFSFHMQEFKELTVVTNRTRKLQKWCRQKCSSFSPYCSS